MLFNFKGFKSFCIFKIDFKSFMVDSHEEMNEIKIQGALQKL